MNTEKFNKGIKDLQNIKMTDVEKNLIFKKITTPEKSPWIFYSLRVALPIALFFLLITGIGKAVNDSLPGDTLYSLKINVIEPTQGFFAGSLPQVQVEWQEKLAIKRIEEGEKLLIKNKLDPIKQEKLSKLITKHSYKVGIAVAAMASSSPKDAEVLGNHFRETMQKNADKLDESRKKIKEKDDSAFKLSQSVRVNGDEIGASRNRKMEKEKQEREND